MIPTSPSLTLREPLLGGGWELAYMWFEHDRMKADEVLCLLYLLISFEYLLHGVVDF